MPLPREGRQRVVIENVTPEIDAGAFPIKRTLGESVVVQADVFADGHDALSVELCYRHESTTFWSSVPMTLLVNDRWEGTFPLTQQGRYFYTVRGAIDHFRSWQRDFARQIDAGQDVRVAVQIGIRQIQAAALRADLVDAPLLRQCCQQAATAEPNLLRELCTDPDLATRVLKWHPPEFVITYEGELCVFVERERARFSSWYEMFPRSASASPGQHGTLRDVIARLPYVAEMGFDVLYLPPIHPIGSGFRKGRNNSLTATEDDVGSPWAIGSAEGGHKAVHPELGTLTDFEELVASAKKLGIEVALDIAFQCSPDHPYLKEHPEWFRIRPDGTIQYAENPPKKYQDIYPFNFETSDWQALWKELRSVFQFWIDRGVRIFRVDNPHTKAFPFWEWCVKDIHAQHPDVILLAEAFTRPKVMYRLAKLGFTQSYTYFAWRHTRRELETYLTELTTTEVADYFRPNFWPNTPDILTEELQHGGRPAFVRRLILAATLSPCYGVYGPPFEHGWCAPVKPGSEEYLHTEKFEVHHHDLARPDSLKPLIARVNRIRRENSALQYLPGLRFLPVDNEQLLCFAKTSPDHKNTLVIVVNLDSRNTHSGFVELPLTELGIGPDEPYQMHDLLTDARYMWCGPRNFVQLNPHELPAHILRIRRRVKSESDREYFQ